MFEEKKFPIPLSNKNAFIEEYRHLKHLQQRRQLGLDAPRPDPRRLEELREIIGENTEQIDQEFKNSAEKQKSL